MFDLLLKGVLDSDTGPLLPATVKILAPYIDPN